MDRSQERKRRNPAMVTGFPSAAADYIEPGLDLNDLIKRKSATFIFQMGSNVLRRAGAFEGALMIVDNSVNPINGSLVLADYEGERIFCYLVDTDLGTMITQTDKGIAPRNLDENSDFKVFGVVIYIINAPPLFGDIRFEK